MGRRKAGTIASRAYAYMQGAGRPCSLVEMCAACGIKRQRSLAWEMQRLRKMGHVEVVGGSRGTKWGPGAKWGLTSKPWVWEDRRGLEPGSVKALQEWVRSAGQLGNLKYVKETLVDGRYHPRPIAKTALEQAWGWGIAPVSRRVDKSAVSCVNGGGQVRPENSGAAD